MPQERVKPWSCARAQLFVKAPAGQGKGRVKALRRDKETLRRGLTSSPYVDVVWNRGEGSQQVMTGLVDTGADWSLIEESQLDVREREELSPTSAQGRGVTEEEIPILGEVWRDLNVGEIKVDSQRFIVVKKMITPVILGADFWGRFGEFSIDFNGRKLRLDQRTELPLKESCSQQDTPDLEVCLAAAEEVTVPASSQVLVRAKVVGKELREGTEILVEPAREDTDGLCQAARTIAEVKEGCIYLRVANVGADQCLIKEGTVVGSGTSTFAVNIASLGSRRRNSTRGKKVDSAKMCGKQLPQGQRKELLDLLEEYEDVFYTEGELGTVHVGVEHRIKLKEGTAPVAHRPRRLSPDEETEVRKEIDDLMEMGVVRQSNSPWAAPIVCARKSDGRLRLAIDYRGLNNVSLPATLHPIPRIDDLFDRLGDAKYFSVMDAKSGYHQLPLKDEEAELTAFVVPWGHYEFKEGTPFGLKGAGYSFQRFMATILGNSNFTDALCYLDDILVWGATWTEHMERLRKVLEKVRAANLRLGPGKCKFGVAEVQYLGVTIKNGMLSISEQRVEALRNLPEPKTVTELRSALGAFSYIQRWLPGLAEVNKPLNVAVKENGTRRLKWTPEMKSSFEKLQKMTASAVALQIPDMDRQFTLVTDGSDKGVGAMLAQEPVDDNEGKASHLIPVAFFHHTLTKAEERYCTTDKELLAVYLAVQRFRVYLGRKFRLITDHMAVKFLRTLNANDERGRRGRWVEFLQQFEIELVHRGGVSKEMAMADYLSRVSKNGNVNGVKIAVVKVSEEGAVPIKGFLSRDRIRKAQDADEEIQGWKKAVSGVNPISGGGEKFLSKFVEDSAGLLWMLYDQGRAGSTTALGNLKRYRVVVPRELRDDVVEFIHCSPTGAHMGFKRTFKRCRDTFWWVGMGKDIRTFIKGCEQCGKNKHETHPNRAPLQITDVPERTFEKLQVDFLGPFPVSSAHLYRYALQIQDILSRYLVLLPAEKDDAQSASELVFEEWFLKVGPPRKIQSDRGTHFANQVFDGMCKLAGVEHKMGAPGHAASQGQVERQNQLMNQVRALTMNNVDSWPKALSRVAYAHNIAKNETTGISPFEMVYAREPRTAESEFISALGEVGSSSPREILKENLKRKETLEEVALSKTRESQIRAQERHETNGEAFREGDKVRIKLSVAERGSRGGKKMAPLYSDCYKVKEVLGAGWTYILTPENGVGKEKARHFDSLKEVLRLGDMESRESEDPARQSLEGGENNLAQTGQVEGQGEIVEGGAALDRIDDILPPLEELPTRRSSRKTCPPSRLQMELDSQRKRYVEKSVPLAEDMVEEDMGDPQ